MKTQGIPTRDLAFIAGGGVVIAVVWGLAVGLADAPLPVIWLLAALGIFLAPVLFFAAWEMRLPSLAGKVREALAPQTGPRAVPEAIAPIGIPVRAEVVRARGVCPMGYRVGHAWTVSTDGRVSSNVCQPLLQAFASAIKALDRDKSPQKASCACPWGNYSLEFMLQPAT